MSDFKIFFQNKVKIKLYGECSESRIIEIDPKQMANKSFRRGAIDSFVLSCHE